jgi:hypothetical protein
LFNAANHNFFLQVTPTSNPRASTSSPLRTPKRKGNPVKGPGLKKARHNYVTKQQANTEIPAEEPFELEVKKEISAYLRAIARINPKTDPIDFWIGHKLQYPILFELTKTIFAIAPTSADAERRFSLAGALLRDKRSRLTPSKVMKILFINSNYHNLKED